MPISQAELWELVVMLDMEEGSFYSGDTIKVTGKVVDHAYETTSGIQIIISAGAQTVKTFTDTDGTFSGEFVDFEGMPGTYPVNVAASWYEMTGLASTEFQIKGYSSPVIVLQQKLSTDEALRYVGADENDFERDPIGQILFRHYQKLQEELEVEKREWFELHADRVILEQKREIARDIRNQTVAENDLGSGTFSGQSYQNYINSLNPDIRELLSSQLNFTKNNFEEAQKTRDEILANGGTYEEARQAYLEIVSIPKEILEQFTQVPETQD